MKYYYRISDNSYPKDRIPGYSKEMCVNNFLHAFNFNDDFKDITIIADNCNEGLIKNLKRLNISMIETNLGNAGSLIFSINHAIENCDPDECVYFCEDDYLHKDMSNIILSEGLKRSDYVTLYDHPDKYTSDYNGGEYSKVIKTQSIHWRYTISTCMTFGAKVKVLKDDIEIWKKHTIGKHPHDHLIFTDLNKDKKRRLAVCIPGHACHLDLYAYACAHLKIDSWVIDYVSNELTKDLLIGSITDEEFVKLMKELQ